MIAKVERRVGQREPEAGVVRTSRRIEAKFVVWIGDPKRRDGGVVRGDGGVAVRHAFRHEAEVVNEFVLLFETIFDEVTVTGVVITNVVFNQQFRRSMNPTNKKKKKKRGKIEKFFLKNFTIKSYVIQRLKE